MAIVYMINVTKIWKMYKRKIKFRKKIEQNLKKKYTNMKFDVIMDSNSRQKSANEHDRSHTNF